MGWASTHFNMGKSSAYFTDWTPRSKGTGFGLTIVKSTADDLDRVRAREREHGMLHFTSC